MSHLAAACHVWGGAPLVSLLLGASSAAHAGVVSNAATAATPSTDAAWTRAFGKPSSVDGDPPTGEHRNLVGTPRFNALLRSSFPQHQYFWHERNRFTSVPATIDTFLGVPGDALLDGNRYLTVNGCVPHVCGGGGDGMLWIDTAAHPAHLIFLAMDFVATPANGFEPMHLWLFSSTQLDWQHLAQPFLASVTRWFSTIDAPPVVKARGWHYQFVSITLVQPSGAMSQLSPALLHLPTVAASGAQP